MGLIMYICTDFSSPPSPVVYGLHVAYNGDLKNKRAIVHMSTLVSRSTGIEQKGRRRRGRDERGMKGQALS